MRRTGASRVARSQAIRREAADAAADAIRHVESGRARGKVIVTV